jgi:hypothetical protein
MRNIQKAQPWVYESTPSVALKGRYSGAAFGPMHPTGMSPFQGYSLTLPRYPGLRPGLWNHAPSGLRRPSAAYLSFQ